MRRAAELIELARRRHAEAAGRVGAAMPDLAPLYREALHILSRASSFDGILLRGLALRELGELAPACEAFETAMRLQPDDARAQRELAASRQALGDIRRAIELYRGLIARDPADALAHAELGQALLAEGDFAAGWEEYEWRLKAPDAAAARAFPFPFWRGEPLAGRTLLVRSEQGIGDEVMFASCIPDALGAGARVVLECSRRLVGLMRRSFPQATVFARSLSAPPDWNALPPIDVQVMAGSLPRYFRRTAADFPGRAYLTADPAAVARWRERFACEGRTVGLAWTGGLPTTLRAARSMTLGQLGPLLEVPGVCFVSLELYDRAEEIAARAVRLASWKGLGADIDDLAAAIAALDLVITVPTTVAHVAGALGKPAWTMAPNVATWRYLSRGERMPWYASVRMYRGADDFPGRMRAALEAWLTRSAAPRPD